jgi:hypothetical protein
MWLSTDPTRRAASRESDPSDRPRAATDDDSRRALIGGSPRPLLLGRRPLSSLVLPLLRWRWLLLLLPRAAPALPNGGDSARGPREAAAPPCLGKRCEAASAHGCGSGGVGARECTTGARYMFIKAAAAAASRRFRPGTPSVPCPQQMGGERIWLARAKVYSCRGMEEGIERLAYLCRWSRARVGMAPS